MALDARLCQELERHGVTNGTLKLLLRFLRSDANGSLAWHVVRGRLKGVEIRLTAPALDALTLDALGTTLLDPAQDYR